MALSNLIISHLKKITLPMKKRMSGFQHDDLWFCHNDRCSSCISNVIWNWCAFFSCLLVKRNALYKFIIICLQGLVLLEKLVWFWDEFYSKATVSVMGYHKSSSAVWAPLLDTYQADMLKSREDLACSCAPLSFGRLQPEYPASHFILLLRSLILSTPCLHSGFISHIPWLLRGRIWA